MNSNQRNQQLGQQNQKNNQRVGTGMGRVGTPQQRRRRGQQIQQPVRIGLSNGDVKRLARRGGIKRISKDVYENIKNIIIRFLEDTIRDGLTVMECSKQKTLQMSHILFAVQRHGIKYLGF